MNMNAIWQPDETKTRHDYRNQLCDENCDEAKTRTAKWRTNVAGYTDLSKRSICGAWKQGYEDSTRFAPQLRTSQRTTRGDTKRTPRSLRGVRVIQKHSRQAKFM
jgi:hypothetical protein